jgi:hypothetical protein
MRQWIGFGQHSRRRNVGSHPDCRCLPVQIAALQFRDYPLNYDLRTATRDHTASTKPNGHAPSMNP